MIVPVPTIYARECGDNGRQEISSATTGAGVVSAWYVLHTRSRQEKALAESLAAMGIEHFLPLSEQVKYYGRRKVKSELPLFPCYLFLKGTREQAFAADRTKRVARIIEVHDQIKLCDELAQIRKVLEGGAELEPYAYLRRGVKVEVTAGPWRGVRGVIEDRARRNRLILQVEVLGQATSMEIDSTLLEPIRTEEDELVDALA